MHFFKNSLTASKCIDIRGLSGNCLLAIMCFIMSIDVRGYKLPRMVAVKAGLVSFR